ncbi:MAG: hypothetical protein JO104_04240 [Candidatus Eremiobacteraeota bacterium]|nr:hypothetical protein [Candidatus Eremiobacteraeota bacterium]
MFLSLLLSAITLAPAVAAPPHTGTVEGYIMAPALSPDATCKPGKICASTTFNRNGCYFNNFWNKTNGGTPLTIDVTQTGSGGSNVYVYWVNSTDTNIKISGKGAMAKYYCT